MKINRILFFILLLTVVFSACQPASLDKSDPDDPWSYAHLRLIDTPDDLPSDLDVIAMYARPTHSGLQVRLDFMDLTNQPQSDLYIALDTKNGGSDVLPTGVHISMNWDLLVYVTADGTVSVHNTNLIIQPNIAAEITIDQYQDTWVMSLQGDDLIQIKGDDQFYVTTTDPSQDEMIDELGPVGFNAEPPEPVHLLLAFWDVMPGYTPAMALRAWDGAHTGPYGGRHGLKHLLIAAARYRVPLALLDLKAPYALSALDILDTGLYLRVLMDESLLILPDVLPNPRFGVLPEWVLARAAGDSRQMAATFGYPASEILYAPGQIPEAWGRLENGYSMVFYQTKVGKTTSEWNTIPQVSFRSVDGPVILLPSDLPAEQASHSGPTLAMRSALLAGTHPNNVQTPFILGGPLSTTTWGDPQAVERTFAWLTDHPWIHILHPSDLPGISSNDSPALDLSTFPEEPGDGILPLAFESTYSDLMNSLNDSHHDSITEIAWQAFLALLSPLPAEPKDLTPLRAGYLNQVGSISAVSDWSHSPASIADCTMDLDWDNQPECVLANETIFTIWEIDGGRMLYAFWRSAEGVHQIVGPSSQLVIGLSDPSSWFGDTTLRDPADIPGGFSDQTPSGLIQFAAYHVEAGNSQLSWSHPDSNLDKIVSLSASKILVEYNSIDQIEVHIPILANPDVRFSPNWVDNYRMRESEDQLTWEWSLSHHVIVSSTGELRVQTFVDSLDWMRLPEDPDQEYPSGLLLPFPMAELSITGQGAFSIVIELK